jgi:hypothetical protein
MTNHINMDLLVGVDKQMHFFSFFIGSLVVGILLICITPIYYARRNLSILWFSIVLIGMIEEFRQYFLPNRSTEFLDGIANIIGASCGILIPFIIVSFYKQQGNNKHLYLFYTTSILIMSVGLWQLNQIHFLLEEPSLKEIVRVFFMMKE